jgi:ferritin-like metal-binding protein YciE
MPTMNALRPLLIDELRDLLDAEEQLTRALPKLARAAAAAPLRTAFGSIFDRPKAMSRVWSECSKHWMPRSKESRAPA